MKAVSLHASISVELDRAVRAFERESGLNRSEAIRELLVRGLGGGKLPVGLEKERRRFREGGLVGLCPPHPASRRIGKGCGQCGDPLAWGR